MSTNENRPANAKPGTSGRTTDTSEIPTLTLPRVSCAVGAFAVGGRLAVATATRSNEVRIDLIGPGGRVSGPLAAVVLPDSTDGTVPEPVVAVDEVEAEWARTPAVMWHLRRRVLEWCNTPRRPIDCPDADSSEWDVASGGAHPLGIMTAAGRTLTVTVCESGSAWIDRLSATGYVAAPVGVITGVGTAIPRLYLDLASREWAGEAPMAWHLTRTAIDRFWSTPSDALHPRRTQPDADAIPRPRDPGPEIDVDADMDSSDGIGPLINDRCRPADVDGEYARWHGPGPYRRSSAHAVEPQPRPAATGDRGSSDSDAEGDGADIGVDAADISVDTASGIAADVSGDVAPDIAPDIASDVAAGEEAGR